MSEKRALTRGQSSVNEAGGRRSSERDDDKASLQRLDDDAGDRLLTVLEDRLDAVLARPPVPFSAEEQKRIEEARSRARTSRFEHVGYISLVGDPDPAQLGVNQVRKVAPEECCVLKEPVVAENRLLSQRRARLRKVIRHGDIAKIFSDAAILEMASDAGLPKSLSLSYLADGVRTAVSIYARDSRFLSPTDAKAATEDLYRAAIRRHGRKVADILNTLPRGMIRSFDPTGRLHNSRARRIAMKGPAAAQICDSLARTLRIGGALREGRKRPGDKRSRPTFEPILRAPTPGIGRPANDAERDLVMWLRVAWLESIGTAAPRTGNSDPLNKGPFVRLCDEVMRRAGAPTTNSAGAINGLTKLIASTEESAVQRFWPLG